jgi:DNA modification methylase
VLEDCNGGARVVGHSAAYPVGLPAFFIAAFSDPGDLIFDPFLGSGTTIVAAEQAGRVGCGTEISPKYVAVILERLAGMGLEPRCLDGQPS